MKISHRDFRPPRRSKYVTQPLKRRPTLRILILAALGVAVYLKFDSVVSSRAFQSLRRPGGPLASFFSRFNRDGARAESPVLPGGLVWATDSSMVEAECASSHADSCLAGWNGLGVEAIGNLRAALAKAAAQWDLEAAGGFSARFRRTLTGPELLDAKKIGFELEGLDLRGARGTVSLNRLAGKASAPLCIRDRCLDETDPHAPFTHFRREVPGNEGASAAAQDAPGSAGISVSSDVPEAAPGEVDEKTRVPEAVFIPAGASPARPILRGRVLEIPSSAKAWMKIYHGENIFSYYRGFSRVREGLQAGSMVGAEDTLGMADGTPAGGLEVRIEKDGLMVDPVAYLGLAPDGAEPAHAR